MAATLAPTTEMQVIDALGIDYRELSLHLVYTDGDPGEFQFLCRLDMDERVPVTDEQVRAILDMFHDVLDDAAEDAHLSAELS